MRQLTLANLLAQHLADDVAAELLGRHADARAARQRRADALPDEQLVQRHGRRQRSLNGGRVQLARHQQDKIPIVRHLHRQRALFAAQRRRRGAARAAASRDTEV